MEIDVLLIDDCEDQLFLLEDELLQADFFPQIQRVDTEKSLNAILGTQLWDVVILDYSMPGFTAEKALEIVEQYNSDIPVIVVSGTANEDKVIKMMQLGAKDYISKRSPDRLIPSINRELVNRKQREKQHIAEFKLRETEHKLALIATAAPDGIVLLNEQQTIEFWNTSATRITKFNETEVLGHNFSCSLFPERSHNPFQKLFIDLKPDQTLITEQNIVKKGGDELIIELSLTLTLQDSKTTIIGILRDISERKRLEHDLKMMTIEDPLTQLFNRRHLVACLAHEIQRVRRYLHPLSIFFIDIDHFKRVNDDFGHAAGDSALIRLAKLLKAEVRKNDICGRYGGEEFLVILPETSVNKAVEFAERICGLIAEIKININKPIELTMTISIGVAEFNDNDSVESFIKKADTAMYQAKNQGRNRVCSFVPSLNVE